MDEQDTSAVGCRRSEAGINLWTRYLLTLVATSFALFAAYSGTLAVLYRTGHLPPPPIVNELCADEKLEWLRDNPPKDPNLLIVGSSLAWRNVDSEQFVLRHPSTRPLNGGVCHLQINQAVFVAEYLVQRIPSIRTVVVVVAPQDLVDCANTPSQLFDPRTADSYVFARRWAYPFYVSHFDFVSLVRNGREIRALRENRDPHNTLLMTRYGDGPIERSHSGAGDLVYSALKRYDPACFAALRTLAGVVTSSGRRLFVAASPVNPAWSARFDPDGRRQDGLVAGVRSAIQDTGAGFWDGDRAFAGKPVNFTDAIHLDWMAAHRYSTLLAAALDADQKRP